MAGHLGRNSPCFCGSGKKFKKCCLLVKHSIEADIRAGAQYIRGDGPFGVIKIKNAPEVKHGAAGITNPKVSCSTGEESDT